LNIKQCVALTGRDTTGPPSRAGPGELRYVAYATASVTNDDRR